MIPWPMMPPDSSLSVGIRSMPPMVVEDRSPMVCTALTTYTMPRDTQAAGTNLISKGMNSGRANQAEPPTPDRSTMPRQRARR